jgi:Cdc6-like AAA superfamily ATPase
MCQGEELTRLRATISGRLNAITASGVRDVFTPAKPIDDVTLFVGRQQEVQRVVEQLSTPGQHAILWGDRGVGKTSLAKYLVRLFGGTMGFRQVFYVACATDSTFTSILEEPLGACGCDIRVTGTTRSVEGKAALEVDLKAVRGTTELSAEMAETRSGAAVGMTPTDVCRYLKDLPALLVVDEAERIKGSDTRVRLAELIKQLSDANAHFKVLIVGIAQAGADLVAQHESIVRCLKETHLRVMPHDELEAIVRSGGAKVGLVFDNDVIEAIAEVSGGYAHYTHLLALKCSEEVIALGRKRVDMAVLKLAMGLAMSEAEESLSSAYGDATRSSANEKSRIILKAAVLLNKIEFTRSELNDKVRAISRENIVQSYLNRLVSSDGHTILRRMQKGVYRFTDPRMPGYIKIANGMVPEDAPKVPLDRSSSR